MSYTHLNAYDRGQIQAFVQEGKNVSAIARILKRDRSCISREIRRNSLRGVYLAEQAQHRYQNRRRQCRPSRKLDYRPLWNYVLDKTSQCWSPETVAGRLCLTFPDDPRMRISHEALYQALYTDERLFTMVSSLRQARPKRRKRGQGKTRRCLIPNRRSIHDRPAEIQDRAEFGHWEGDLVLGKNQQGAIATLVERKSRMLLARKLDCKQSQLAINEIISALEGLPAAWGRTITFDNGTEFFHHQQITEQLGIDTYFADPYAAYQRGTNENTNGLIRQYLPKGSSFEHLTQKQLDVIVEELNNRPRKVLGYRTPHEVFQSNRKPTPVALEA